MTAKGKRVAIAVDDSEFAEYAFNCKLTIVLNVYHANCHDYNL